ncbi:mRNA decay activator protein ZFP36 [Lepisosteus oculatus]|uniref:mRNA decay activator protein ZFP36 n=1 Tax=Lepisosteus oculatus TaxID=7918 RepID=UPI003718AA74
MSDVLAEETLMNLLNMSLEESFCQKPVKQMALRRNLSTSTQPSATHYRTDAFSSEQLSDIEGWPVDSLWSKTSPTRGLNTFRSDRSMSLTEGSIQGLGRTRTPEVPPPPGFPPLNASALSSRYKTELCRSYQENRTCKYGNKCQFAHGEAELRGQYRHPKYKTEACRTFYNFGYCPYGSRCHFIHEEKPYSAALQQGSPAPDGQQPRLFRQSVSFGGFPGSRSSPPPTLQDPLGFTRAPSVSPPPADLLSPVFSEAGGPSLKSAFQFCQSRPSLSDIHGIPHIVEPQKSACCVCGHSSGFQAAVGKANAKEDQNSPYIPLPNLQRFSSEDSLSDRESYSSSGSMSGSESPTFDSIGSKRLSVFARMSLSD